MNIPQDKLLHAGVCCFVALVIGWFFILNPQFEPALCLTFIVPMLIGFGKEIYDKLKGGTFSWMDIIFDFIGTVIGCVVTALCAIIVNI